MTAHYDPGDGDQQEWLGRLAAGAHAAGNASVAANPADPAHWMLFDGHQSVPVVHREGCYICEDPEFAAMGLPLCSPCPDCVRRMEICTACGGRGGMPDSTPCTDCLATGITGTLGHIAADDTTCDECDYEHGPDDYGEDGLLTGMPREKALFVYNLKHPGRERS
jgi:hypothetical protein